MGYFLFNYIDDFIGVEVKQRIWKSFHTYIRLLQQLHIRESAEKWIPPTQVLNCVGTLVDGRNKTMSILPERKTELLSELHSWLNRENCTLKDIQKLIGKLQFVCAVVRPGRIFLSRMLDTWRSMNESDRVAIDPKFRKDINWWLEFLPGFEGMGILWMHQMKEPDLVAASDSCLVGMGAVSGRQYVKLTFPPELQSDNIARLELLAIIIMVKTWLERFKGNSVLFRCDNEAVVNVINTGRAWDPGLLDYLRELSFLAVGTFEFRAVHLEGRKNVLPDLLSRWEEGERVRNKFYESINGQGYTEVKISQDLCSLSHVW